MTHAIVSQFVQQQTGRRAWLGGNIGTSLLPLVDQIQPHDIVILELSSFQLVDLDRLQVSPHVAVVTNFAPNHLDWHPNLEHYREAKQAIFRWQGAGDFAVLNDDDAEISGWSVGATRLGFGLRDAGNIGVFMDENEAVLRLPGGERRLPLMNWLKLPGRHNISNALAAIAASVSIGADPANIQTAIENYEPLPHRLQFVGEAAGRRFYNDSLATTPESSAVALTAFNAPIVLLAGGYDKQVNLGEMATSISSRAKAVALMGQTGAMLRQLIMSCENNSCDVSEPQTTFAAAFDWAIELRLPEMSFSFHPDVPATTGSAILPIEASSSRICFVATSNV